MKIYQLKKNNNHLSYVRILFCWEYKYFNSTHIINEWAFNNTIWKEKIGFRVL